MPSAGMIPFVQSFTCNLENKCDKEDSVHRILASRAQMSQMFARLQPHLVKPETVAGLGGLKDSLQVVDILKDLLDKDEVPTSIVEGDDLKVRNLLRDPDEVFRILVDGYGVLSEEAAHALLNSSLNVAEILDLTGYVNFKKIVCDPIILMRYVIFEASVDIEKVSAMLCKVDNDLIPQITDFMFTQIDIAAIMKIAERFALIIGDYELGHALEDIAKLFEMLSQTSILKPIMNQMPAMHMLPEILKKLPHWVTVMMDAQSLDMTGFHTMINSVDPLIQQIAPGDPIWEAIKYNMQQSAEMSAMLFEPGTNVTTLMGKLQEMMDMLPPLNDMDFNAIMSMGNIPFDSIWSMLGNSSMEDGVEKAMDAIQQTIETYVGKDVALKVMSVIDLQLDLSEKVVLFTEKFEFEVEALGQNMAVVEMLDSLLDMGSPRAVEVLSIFTNPQTILTYLNSQQRFQQFCTSTMSTYVQDVSVADLTALKTTVCNQDIANLVDDLKASDLYFRLDLLDVEIRVILSNMNKVVTGERIPSDLRLYDIFMKAQKVQGSMWSVMDTPGTWLTAFKSMSPSRAAVFSEPEWSWLEYPYTKTSMVIMMMQYGPILETYDSLWAYMGPMVRLLDVMLKDTAKQTRMSMDMMNTNTDMGMLLWYMVEYAPEITEATMNMMDNKYLMNEVQTSMQDPKLLFCGDHLMQRMDFDSKVPVTEIENLICKMDWEQMMMDMMSAYDTTYRMEEIARIFNESTNYGVSRGFDWKSFSEGVYDGTSQLLTGQSADPPSKTYDWNKVTTALSIYSERMEARPLLQTGGETDLILSVLDDLDGSMENDMIWRKMKLYALAVNANTKFMINLLSKSDVASMGTLEYYSNISVTLGNLHQANADITPDLMEAMANTMLEPNRLIDHMLNSELTGEWSGDCTKLLEIFLNTTSNTNNHADALCNVNWTQVAIEIMTSYPSYQEYQNYVDLLTRIEMGFMPEVPNLTVDWQELNENMGRYFSLVSNMTMQNVPESSLWEDLVPGLDMARFNTSLQKMMAALMQSSQINIEQLPKMLEGFDAYSGLLSEQNSNMQPECGNMSIDSIETCISEPNFFMWMGPASNYITHYFNKFAIAQLEFLNQEDRVDLLAYLNSTEVNKLFRELEQSPVGIKMQLQTLLELLTAKDQSLSFATYMMDLENLCNDPAAFNGAFMLPKNTSSLTVEMAASIFCDMPAMNYDKLVLELSQSLTGFGDLLKALDTVVAGLFDPETMTVSVSTVLKENQQFQQLIEAIIMDPPEIVITMDTDWMNTSIYQHQWETFVEQFTTSLETQPIAEQIAKHENNQLFFLWIMAEDPYLNHMMAMAHVYMKVAIQRQENFNDAMTNPEDTLKDFPEMDKIWKLMDELPDAYLAWFYTDTKYPEKTAFVVEQISSICLLDPASLLMPVPGSVWNIGPMVTTLCSINTTVLMEEIDRFQGNDILPESAKMDATTGLSNMTFLRTDVGEFVKDLGRMSTLMEESTHISPDGEVLPRFLNATVWEGVQKRLSEVAGPRYPGASTSLADTLAYVAIILQKSEDQWQYANYIPGWNYFNVMFVLGDTYTYIDRILQGFEKLPNGSFTLEDFFPSSPTIQQLLGILQKPGVLEVVLFSSNTPKFAELYKLDESTFAANLCQPTSDLSKYFTVPPESTFDLTQLKADLCSLNITALYPELANEYPSTFAPKGIVAFVNDVIARLMSLIDKFTESPLDLDVPMVWKTGQFWTDTLNKINEGQQFSFDPQLWDSMMPAEDMQGVFKATHTFNLIVGVINDRLMYMQGNVSLSTLLQGNINIAGMLDPYINAGNPATAAMLREEINLEALLKLIDSPEMFASLCSNQSLARFISTNSTTHPIAADLEKVMCLFPELFFDAMLDKAESNMLTTELTKLLNSTELVPPPDWVALQKNIEHMSTLLTGLLMQPPPMEQDNILDFNTTMNAFTRLMENPMVLLRLWGGYDGLIDTYLNESMLPIMQGLGTAAEPLLNLLQDMQSNPTMSWSSLLMHFPDDTENFLNGMMAMDSQLVKIADSFIKPYIEGYGEMPEIQKLVCNETLLSSIGLPSDVSHLLCGAMPADWYEKLVNNNVSQSDLNKLLKKFQYYMMDFDIPESFQLPFGMRWSELINGIDNMSGMMMGSSNGTDWKSMVQHLQEYASEQGSNSLIDLLRGMDIEGDPGTNYILGSLSGYLQFLTTLNKYLDDQNLKIESMGHSVPLIAILPNSTILADLLTELSGKTTAANFLNSIINPMEVLELTGTDLWPIIVCDPDSFSQVFHFPSDFDVAGIQRDLCFEAKRQESAINNYLSQLEIGDVLKSLSDWVMGSDTRGDLNSTMLWHKIQMNMDHFMQRLDELGGFNLTLIGLDGWAQPLASVSTSSFEDMSIEGYYQFCVKMEQYMNNSNYYETMFEPVLSEIMMSMESSTSQLKMQEAIDEIICEMSSMNITAIMQRLIDSDIQDMIASMGNPARKRFGCSQMFASINELNDSINRTVMRMMRNEQAVGQCVSNSLWQSMDFYQNLTKTFSVGGQMFEVLADPTLRSLSENEELVSLLETLLTSYMQQEEMTWKLTDMISNMTAAEGYLEDSLEMAPEVISSLLGSTVKLDTAMFANKSVEEIVDIICDPSQLEKVMSVPEMLPVNPRNLTDIICDENVKEIAILLKSSVDLGLLGNLFASMGPEDIMPWNRLNLHIQELTEQLGEIIKLQNLMDFDKFDSENLKLFLPKLQHFLLNFGPEPFVASLQAVLEDLKAIDDSPFTTALISDLQIFAGGLMGLNILKKHIPESIIISDIIKTPDDFKAYLMYDLAMSSDVADVILDGSIHYAVLLEAVETDLTERICDDEKGVRTLFNWNSAVVEVDEIREAFCGVNKSVLPEMVEAILTQLDIGDLAKQYVLTNGNTLLKDSNITATEAKEKMKYLVQAQDGMSELSVVFEELHNEKNMVLEKLFNLDLEVTGPEAMTDFSPLLCGDGNVSIADSFGLGRAIDGKNKKLTSRQKAIIAEIPGEFCQDVFRKIHRSENGAIVWAYLKPIMYGKILYTPDNPVTRKIIEKTNGVFKQLNEIKSYAELWGKGTKDIQELMKRSENMVKYKDLLSNSFVSGLLEDAVGVSGKDLVAYLLSTDEKTEKEMNSFIKVAQLIANYTSCVESENRFIALSTEKELMSEAARLEKKQMYLAGLVFLNSDDEDQVVDRKKRDSHGAPHLPKHIAYKIRMDIDNVPYTSLIKERMWRPHPYDEFGLDLRYLRGFSQLQDMVERAIISLQSGKDVDNPKTYIQQFPFPCHERDLYLHVLSAYLLPVMMTLAWIAALGIATRNLVHDREDGQEESLKIMGMHGSLNWWAWMLSTIFLMAITSLLCVVILKYGELYRYSDFGIMFLFFLDFCFSTMMLCYFVSAFFTRTTLAILTVLIVYLISYLPYIVLVALEVQMLFWQKTVACLSCTTAFAFGAQYLARYEEQVEGLQWHNIRESPLYHDNVNFHWICIMMLIDSAIYLVLGWYIRNVKPGKYGVAQPWYFPICPYYWGCCKSTPNLLKYLSNEDEENTGVLQEKVPDGTTVGVSLHGLTKYFNKKKVVDNLNANIYAGQVTALLGHNGAAKTTTIKMMIGILDPTKGHVFVYEKPVHKTSRMIGICPQHNALYPYMTVKEHMEFYSLIKSDKCTEKTKEEIIQLLKDVDLWYAKDVLTKDLSGGMKRKLCVALAFVGGSRVVILDEPSSGVDPNGRRSIWNLIGHKKKDCAVLLSTHHLDEADLIGDRVAIMHNGKLMCVGSSMFLKQKLGSGYTLTISKAMDGQKSCDPSEVLVLLQSQIPTAQLVEDVGSEMTFSLPTESRQLMYQLLLKLDDYKEHLHIAGYGISDTSLEEVFMKVCEVADSGERLNPKTLQEQRVKMTPKSTVEKTESLSSHEIDNRDMSITISDRRPKQSIGGFGKFWALLVKRFHHYRRDWRMLISVMLLPCIFFAIAMGLSTIKRDDTDAPELLLTPPMYGPNTYDFAKDDVNNIQTRNIANSLMTWPGIGTTCMKDFPPPGLEHVNLKKYTCKMPDEDFSQSDYKRKGNPVCRCSDYQYSCDEGAEGPPPPQRMTATTDILQALSNKNITKYLTESYWKFTEKRYGGWSFENDPKTDSYFAKIWFNNQGYHSLAAFHNAFSNALLRASVPSEEQGDYGITLINHPLLLSAGQLNEATMLQNAADIGLSLCVLFAFTFVPAGLILFVVNENVKKEKQLQFVQGISPCLYWFASFIWDLLFFCVTVGLCVIIMAIFQLPSYWLRLNLPAIVVLLILYGFATLPWMYCLSRLFRDGSSSYMVLFCLNNFIGICCCVVVFVLRYFSNYKSIEEAGEVLRYLFLIFPAYSLGEGLIIIASNQLQTMVLERFNTDVYKNPFSFEMLAWHFVALAIEGVVFFFILLIIEYRSSCAKRDVYKPSMEDDDKEDEEVRNERHRVQSGFTQNDAVVVRDLSKVFKRGRREFLAVDHINFGVSKGECFGLLGINGAGKTTTFRMLTGDCKPSDGDATVSNRRIGDGQVKLGQEVGYCPQEDALDDYLTGRELLHYYAKLRGLSSSTRDQDVNATIKQLSMSAFVNKTIKTYSGGMKRRLSLAIALLGEPSVVFLDEPTSGMDPATKRLTWNCILSAAQNGQSVILTSHSMEECDALCSKLSIMVNGQMRCLGSPQLLKNKYGGGYTVKLYLYGLGKARPVMEFIHSHFPGAMIKEQMNVIEISIPRDSTSVANIFGVLEQQKNNYNIQYYSVSQTTLNTVFLNFAKEQTDGLPQTLYEDSGTESSGSERGEFTGLEPSRGYSNRIYGYNNAVFSKKDEDDKHAGKGTQDSLRKQPLDMGIEVSPDEIVVSESNATYSKITSPEFNDPTYSEFNDNSSAVPEKQDSINKPRYVSSIKITKM